MSKKLLSEAQVRRFAKLANLSPINEMDYKRDDDLEEAYGGNKGDESRSKRDYMEEEYGGKKGDESKSRRDYMEEEAPYGGNKGDESRSKRDYMKEDAFEDEAEMGADAAEGELDDAEMAGLEDEAGDEVEMDADLGEREALAMDVISAVADALNIEVDIEGGEAEGEEMEMDAADDMAAADDLDADAMADEEEAIMEALKGINYIPGKKEIVNEVAKRVARRLLKAKKADQALQEALGKRKTTK